LTLITFRDRNTSGDPVGPTWYLQFDAATVEEYARAAEITTYPVETGAILSDHYQPQPRQISLTGVVSDTPSGTWTNIESLQNAAAPPVMVTRPLELRVRPDPSRTGPYGALRPVVTGPLPSQRLIQGNIERAKLYIPRWAQTLQVSGSEAPGSGVTRIASFVSVLDALMEQRIQVSVVMITGTEYTDLMIADMRAPRSSGSGGSVTVSLELQQVIKAAPATSRASEQRENPAVKKKKVAGTRGTRKPTKDEIALARLNEPLSSFFPYPNP
jgi:hypothetical protein